MTDILDQIEAMRYLNNKAWMAIERIARAIPENEDNAELNDIFQQRVQNNKRLMRMLRAALEQNPADTKTLLLEIASTDMEIARLARGIADS